MAAAALTPVTVDALPDWSPWPAKLLGLSAARQQRRTTEHLRREFNLEKYGALLAAVEREPGLSLEQVRRLEIGDPEQRVAMSIGDELFGASLGVAIDRLVAMQLERITAVTKATGAATVVDLGCGYGYLLARLRSVLGTVELRGGEHAPNGVALAERLHHDDRSLTVDRFDFLSTEACRPLEAARPPIVDQAATARRFARRRGRS